MMQMLPLFARITALIDSAQIGTVADEVVGPIDGSQLPFKRAKRNSLSAANPTLVGCLAAS